MPVIDNRLLDCNGEPELTENLNRVLALVDALRVDLTAAQEDIEETHDTLASLGSITTRTVTFNSDGGSAVDIQTVVYGGVASEPDDPLKEGYVFGGWYLNETEYSFGTAVTDNIALIAHWDEEGPA